VRLIIAWKEPLRYCLQCFNESTIASNSLSKVQQFFSEPIKHLKMKEIWSLKPVFLQFCDKTGLTATLLTSVSDVNCSSRSLNLRGTNSLNADKVLLRVSFPDSSCVSLFSFDFIMLHIEPAKLLKLDTNCL
jgi:hypothetical protein